MRQPIRADVADERHRCRWPLRSLGVTSVSHLPNSISRIMNNECGIVHSHSLSPKACFLSVRGTGGMQLKTE